MLAGKKRGRFLWNRSCKIRPTGDTLVAKHGGDGVLRNTSKWRYFKRTKGKGSPSQSQVSLLKGAWRGTAGVKGGRLWLLDTNHLWRGAFGFRRKVVPLMLQTLITHALRVFVCGYSWDQRYFERQTALTPADTLRRTHRHKHRLISVKSRGTLWN